MAGSVAAPLQETKNRSSIVRKKKSQIRRGPSLLSPFSQFLGRGCPEELVGQEREPRILVNYLESIEKPIL